MMKVIGIYQIQSKIKPERIYIGSSVDVYARKSSHFSTLRRRVHDSKKLQRHYNKYGEDDLVFSVLCECEKEQLLQLEQYFIDLYIPWFNICQVAGDCTKRTLSVYTKNKISKSRKGYKISPEVRKRMNQACKGRPPWNTGLSLSEEHKHKISIANKGKKLSPETKRKIGEKSSGRRFSDDVKDKMRLAKVGKSLTPEHRKKISDSNKGKHKDYVPSDETRLKMSLARRGKTPWNKGKTLSDEYRLKLSIAAKCRKSRINVFNND